MILSLFFSIFLVINLSAEEKPGPKDIEFFLIKLKNLKMKEFSTKIINIQEGFDKYFEYKKRVCSGEFSSLILSDSSTEQVNQENRKLNSKEKALCYKNLIEEKKIYISNLFDKRIDYAEYIHTLNIEKLKASKNEALKSFNSRNSRKRKRR